MFGNMNPTCSIRKNAESVERLSVISLAIGNLVVEDWQSLNAKLHSLSILLGLFYD
ncbi:hypothetical protein [Acinetobacter nosocomialis]|uniref:hypothetical protein n=1 Tax=Acinetobacter nosocomialis TaxID=106654 RepID=UPI000A98148A|nr:hypothetical protein [Acinetobacter nosocomialis]